MHAGKVEVVSSLLFLSESERVSDFELMGVCGLEDGTYWGINTVVNKHLWKSLSETDEQRL